MRIFTPPNQIEQRKNISVFLAGTIDMGNSEDWQTEFTRYFKEFTQLFFYNPRRESWDNSWEQKFENPQFYQQVNWELDALERADYIVLNLLPDSKSPITLLELGLFAKSGKLLVCCPDEFYRSGNIQIVCDKYRIPLYKNLTELKEDLRYAIN